jgi:hypothetical protein
LEVDMLDYHLGRGLGVLSGYYYSLQRTIPSVRTNFSPPSLLA